MGNGFFENEEYRIRNGVLEAYLGEKKKISVAPQISSYKIKKIGKKAFRSKNFDTLIIREGIEEIEEGAFSQSHIRSLILPTTVINIEKNIFSDDMPENIVISRRITKGRWNQIRNRCIPVASGYFLLKNQSTEDIGMDTILEIFSQKNLFPRVINENMMTLFSMEDREDIVFDNKKIKSKDFMIGYLIRNGIYASVNEEVDSIDDYNFRNSGSTRARHVVLCKLFVDDDSTNCDCVIVKAYFVKGIYYWMRIEKIIFNGKTYYVSSKEFLNPDDKIPYMKKVEKVYDDTEFEVNGKVKEMVLRKYNLLRNIP